METNICKIKFRRGQNEQRQAIIPEEGEPIFTTDTKRFAIGDGETKGGIVLTQTYITSSDIPSGVVAGDIIYKPDKDSNGVYIVDNDGKSNCIGGTQLLQTNMPISLNGNKITLSYDSNFTLTENNSALTFNVVQAKKTLDIPTINDNILECKTDINTLSNIRLDYSIAPLIRYSAIHNINGIEITPIPVDDLELVNNTIEDTSNVFNNRKYPYIKTWDTNTAGGSSLRYGISENLAYDTCFELITSDITVLTSVALTSTPISTLTTIEKVSTDVNGIEIKFNEETVLWSDSVSAFCGTGKITISALSLSKDAKNKLKLLEGNDGNISGGVIEDDSITENKLSEDVRDKLNKHPNIVNTTMLVDGCVTTDKIADEAVTESKLSSDLKDKLLPDNVDYVIEQNHDIQTIPAFKWNDNYTIKTDIAGFSFKIERWSRKWKSGLIENWGYRKFNRTEQIDDVPNDVYDSTGRGYLELLTPHTSINYNVQLCCEWNGSQYNSGYTTVWVDPNNKYEAGGNKHKGWFLTTHIASMLNYYTRGY